MQLIAHRVFQDGVPPESFDPGRVAGFDGLELDLRLSRDGRLVVDHAPLFAGLRPRAAGAPLAAVMDVIGSLRHRPRVLLLDVKCVTAAAAAADFVAAGGLEAGVVFACWHEGEIEAIRARLPQARTLYVFAPIVASRAPRLGGLYVANSFPFLWSAAKFTPRLDKTNRHNINVALVSRRRGIETLPPTVDGLCVHRLFWTPSLAAIAAAKGLSVAVYGLRSQDHARETAAAKGAFDYAIIGEARAAKRAAARRTLPLSA